MLENAFSGREQRLKVTSLDRAHVRGFFECQQRLTKKQLVSFLFTSATCMGCYTCGGCLVWMET